MANVEVETLETLETDESVNETDKSVNESKDNNLKTKISQEEKRKELQQKLRNKIKNKSASRNSKTHSNNHMTEAVQQIKDMGLTNEQINNLLSSQIADASERKRKKKQLKKMMSEI